jgi:hypothetical protein
MLTWVLVYKQLEGEYIETAQKHWFSLCVQYIESCVRNGVMPSFMTALKLCRLHIEDCFCVLGLWVTWDE